MHQPTFITKATVNEQEFTGTGNSKAKAKQDLAARVLSHIVTKDISNGLSAYTGGGETNPSSHRLEWRTSDGDLYALDPATRIKLAQQIVLTQGIGESAEGTPSMPGRDRPLYAPPRFRSPTESPFIRSPTMAPTVRTNTENHNTMVSHVRPMSPPQAVAKKFSQMFVNRPPIDFEKAKSYPVMVLVELFPEMKIEWVDGVGRGDRQFRVESEIHGRRFFGEGRSKKIAKLNLAKTVLLCMYDIHDFKDTDTSPKPVKQKIEGSEVSFEKKFPLTQLKELVGEDVQYDIQQINGDEDSDEAEKMYNCTVVIKGVEYSAVGKNRNLAKLRCAKRALEVLKPKKEGGKLMIIDNEPGSPGEKREIDTSRHPSMVFHELFRDVRISESETKASNGLPEYHMEAEIEGKIFQAKANAKKKAKLRLVLAALEQLRDIPNETWENVDLKDVYEDKQPSNNPATNHPIVLLLKLNPNTRFSVSEDYECDAAEKYKAIAYVGDKEFHGQGPNKKAAKTMAARLSLTSLYGIDPDTYVEESRTDYFENQEPRYEVKTDLCNAILDCVQAKFTEVFQGETQCKVIASFVLATYSNPLQNPQEHQNGEGENMGEEEEMPQLNVVSIGTGTKCITGDQMDHKGQTLNDSHGEVIACRGFRQFLFNELKQTLQGEENTVFVKKEKVKNRYSFKPNMCVYLYVNTAPCGDGRVFTLQTPQQGAKNKTAGLLRTKIENGQGTIPVPENNVQTSDGILEGERLRTMSCSDKILKWNAIGIQGALLSYLIDPVYIEGIVVGLHYNYDVLYRALYKRAGKMDEITADFPNDYCLKMPKLGSPTQIDNRDTSKATSNSFNWYQGEKTVEAVNSTTGKSVVLTPSRLCKLNFFDKFMQIIKVSNLKVKPETYHHAKLLAKNYQKAKEHFFQALGETDCGKWIGKPYEHDMFGY